MITTNSPAPDFSLPDQEGKVHKLSDYKGQWVLLYFYPKDDTSGCTKEACMIRDNLPEFDKLNAQVLGVSVDSVKSHDKFAKKYSLNFTILSDEQKEVVGMYDVWKEKKLMGKTYMGTQRSSFLIRPDGSVVKIYPEVDPAKHAAEVIADLQEFSSK